MDFTAVVLNLDSRQDRLREVSNELRLQGIPFERFSAIRHEEGWKGYNQSIIGIFKQYQDVDNLFMFEDDCYFEANFDRGVLSQLPQDYDGLWLGSNLQSDHFNRYSDNLSILQNGWNTHATLMSKAYRDWCLENWDGELVFDEWVRVNALPVRKCFVLRPMIAFQRPSMSDIEKKHADYTAAWQTAKSRLH